MKMYSFSIRAKGYAIVFIALLLLTSTIELAAQSGEAKYWIFFKDKAISGLGKRADLQRQAASRLTKRALTRRAKVRSHNTLTDELDFPVADIYVNRVRNLGAEPVATSRWLNGISAIIAPEDIEVIRQLDFVRGVRRVSRPLPRPDRNDTPAPLAPKTGPASPAQLDYGSALFQNQQIGVVALHDLGITGKGIWIGMLDSGFRYRNHEVFEAMDIAEERDFINDDDLTENEGGQDIAIQDNHGTQTLSVIGGYKDGRLIGVAFNSRFFLGKTEDVSREVPLEEDLWVEGIEWLEEQGVDVVSSSLGYTDWYDNDDMNGNTAVTTIAADIAVDLGIVVVTSAGNEGDDPWRIISAPADGRKVIAVGAVNSGGQLVSFSSVGPTADGRIKPEVVAMGASVYTGFPVSDKAGADYRFSDGTSFSAPLVAGAAALILSAHPHLTPEEIREGLLQTASQSNNPDNFMGWGLIDALAATLYHGPAFGNDFEIQEIGDTIEITVRVAGGGNALSLFYENGAPGSFIETSMSPTVEPNTFSTSITKPADGDTLHFYFKTTDDGVEVTHPRTAPSLAFSYPDDGAAQSPRHPVDIPSDFTLYQSYPNPFDLGIETNTTISFDLNKRQQVTLTIYNVRGQAVRTLINGRTLQPGRGILNRWDGYDDNGRQVTSGVYFYELRTPDTRQANKLFLIRATQ